MRARRLALTDEGDEVDQEELVQQVLREFPPEERGERDEWTQQVGWHRKENIRKGVMHPDRQGDAKGSKEDIDSETELLKGDKDQVETLGSPPLASTWIPLTIVLLLLVALAIVSKCLLRKTKRRTQ